MSVLKKQKKFSLNFKQRRGVVVVGLFGNQIRMPLVASVINEYQVVCSHGGIIMSFASYNLAKQRKIKHSIQKFSLSDVNNAINWPRSGHIHGRGVIMP